MKRKIVNKCDILLNTSRQNLKDSLTLKYVYSFQFNDKRVRVVFSDNSNAQTIENALVKIATRRIS